MAGYGLRKWGKSANVGAEPQKLPQWTLTGVGAASVIGGAWLAGHDCHRKKATAPRRGRDRRTMPGVPRLYKTLWGRSWRTSHRVFLSSRYQ